MEIAWNGSTLYYDKIGTGSENLLLFHGYGQDSAVFRALARTLSDRYTCFCFDLFFHGRSHWAQGETPLLKEHWKLILEAFIKKENIPSLSVLGFSIGARYALATIECSPVKINRAFLIAPDGIKENLWYTAATYPWATRKLFKKVMQQPGPFFKLAALSRKMKLIHPKVLQFAEHEMRSEKKRSTIYYTWVITRKLRFDIKELAKRIRAAKTDVIVILGKQDPLIRHQMLTEFIDLAHATVILVEEGHNRLIQAITVDAQRIFKAGSEARY